MMMSKRIKYLLILCCFSTSLVFSQDKTISKKLGEVIVSENRASSSENITNVFVISAKEIKDAWASNVQPIKKIETAVGGLDEKLKAMLFIHKMLD